MAGTSQDEASWAKAVAEVRMGGLEGERCALRRSRRWCILTAVTRKRTVVRFGGEQGTKAGASTLSSGISCSPASACKGEGSAIASKRGGSRATAPSPRTSATRVAVSARHLPGDLLIISGAQRYRYRYRYPVPVSCGPGILMEPGEKTRKIREIIRYHSRTMLHRLRSVQYLYRYNNNVRGRSSLPRSLVPPLPFVRVLIL